MRAAHSGGGGDREERVADRNIGRSIVEWDTVVGIDIETACI